MSTPFLRVRPWNFAHTRVHCAPAEPITNECVFFLFSFLVRYLGLYICWGIFGVLRDPTFSAGKNKKHIRKRLGKGTLNTCANFSGSKADDIGNAMSQSYLPKLFKKKPAEDTLVPPPLGTQGKNVFRGLFVHAAVRGGTCAFTLKIVNRLIKNSSRDDRPSIST